MKCTYQATWDQANDSRFIVNPRTNLKSLCHSDFKDEIWPMTVLQSKFQDLTNATSFLLPKCTASLSGAGKTPMTEEKDQDKTSDASTSCWSKVKASDSAHVGYLVPASHDLASRPISSCGHLGFWYPDTK